MELEVEVVEPHSACRRSGHQSTRLLSAVVTTLAVIDAEVKMKRPGRYARDSRFEMRVTDPYCWRGCAPLNVAEQTLELVRRSYSLTSINDSGSDSDSIAKSTFNK